MYRTCEHFEPTETEVSTYAENFVKIPKSNWRSVQDLADSKVRLRRAVLKEVGCSSSELTVPSLHLETCTEQEEVIELRDIPIEQIKAEMLDLQSDGKTRWADEIAEILELDVMDVIEAFNQLQEEGRLFVDNDRI